MSSENDFDFGRLYLGEVLQVWGLPDREERLPAIFHMIVDNQVYWVIDDILEGNTDPRLTKVAESALEEFLITSVNRMMRVVKRQPNKGLRNRYSGAAVTDLKLAVIMASLISLYDQAYDQVTEALDTATAPNKQLPPPKGGKSK